MYFLSLYNYKENQYLLLLFEVWLIYNVVLVSAVGVCT